MFKKKVVPAVVAHQNGGPLSSEPAPMPARLQLFEDELNAVTGGLKDNGGGPPGCTTDGRTCCLVGGEFILDDGSSSC